jgi:hypothetical protein
MQSQPVPDLFRFIALRVIAELSSSIPVNIVSHRSEMLWVNSDCLILLSYFPLSVVKSNLSIDKSALVIKTPPILSRGPTHRT